MLLHDGYGVDRQLGLSAARRHCNPARTFILCRAKGLDFRQPLAKPKSCDTLGPRDSFSEAVNLRKLSWRNWGKSEARGTGVSLGYHLPFGDAKVSLHVYRRRLGECGDYIYTRLRESWGSGSRVIKFPALCGDHL